jgi:MFS transporter, UMF1 family
MQVSIISIAYTSLNCTTTGKHIAVNQTVTEAEDSQIDCKANFPGTSLPVVSGFLILSAISNIISMLSLPILGAAADSTPRRRLFTLGTLCVYIIYQLPLAFVNESNWAVFVIALLFGVQFIREFHDPCLTAYCSEIAEGEGELVSLQSIGRTVELVSMLLFLLVVGVLGSITELDVSGTASMGNLVFVCIALPMLGYASTHLLTRPALRKRGKGGKIFDPVFQLCHTIKLLWQKDRSLLQLLVGVACIYAGTGGVIFLTPVYAMQQLNVKNPTNLVGLTMLSSIPGSLIANWAGKVWGTKSALVKLSLLLIASIISMVLFVVDKESIGFIYPLTVSAGIALGGIHPMLTSLYITAIPAGQEVEMQGIYLFFAQSLNFVPNLWFGYCVDAKLGGAGNSRRFGLSIIVVLLLVAVLLCGPFFDEKAAKERASSTAHMRFRAEGSNRSQRGDTSKVTPSG